MMRGWFLIMRFLLLTVLPKVGKDINPVRSRLPKNAR